MFNPFDVYLVLFSYENDSRYMPRPVHTFSRSGRILNVPVPVVFFGAASQFCTRCFLITVIRIPIKTVIFSSQAVDSLFLDRSRDNGHSQTGTAPYMSRSLKYTPPQSISPLNYSLSNPRSSTIFSQFTPTVDSFSVFCLFPSFSVLCLSQVSLYTDHSFPRNFEHSLSRNLSFLTSGINLVNPALYCSPYAIRNHSSTHPRNLLYTLLFLTHTRIYVDHFLSIFRKTLCPNIT